jgi:hypothetical protein
MLSIRQRVERQILFAESLQINVRFGSKADICNAKGHVRFTPDSDRESGFPQTVMSTLPPKADMRGATKDVRYGPKADIRRRDLRELAET